MTKLKTANRKLSVKPLRSQIDFLETKHFSQKFLPIYQVETSRCQSLSMSACFHWAIKYLCFSGCSEFFCPQVAKTISNMKKLTYSEDGLFYKDTREGNTLKRRSTFSTTPYISFLAQWRWTLSGIQWTCLNNTKTVTTLSEMNLFGWTVSEEVSGRILSQYCEYIS